MLLLCGAWGFNMVAMKVGKEGIPPVLQAALRSAVAAPLLLAWCRWRGVALGDWRRDGTLLPGLAIGAVFGLEFLFLYTSLGFTTASRAVVFLYTAPFFVALGVHFLLPDNRLTPAKAAGLGVAFVGLLLAFAEGFAAPAAGEATLLGDAMCLLAGVLWAATTLMLKTSRLRAAPPALALLTNSSCPRRSCCSPRRCWARASRCPSRRWSRPPSCTKRRAWPRSATWSGSG